MRTRPRVLLLVIASLLASTAASVTVLTATTDTAHACSIAGPYAEVSPAGDLYPGQNIQITGWAFSEIRVHEASPTPLAEADRTAQLGSCDFDIIPLNNLDVHWHGNSTSWLGAVSGPDFVLHAIVPRDALAGPAIISVGPVELAVAIGEDEIPLPPCPLTLQPDGSISHSCPEPWPCPLHRSADTQPAPGADHAPGFVPCPKPCVDYAHTIDDGTVYDYQWDCPDPCGPTEVHPGAGDSGLTIWCPPPDPCLALVGCPDPCPPQPTTPSFCPVPCGLDNGATADWCAIAEATSTETATQSTTTATQPTARPVAPSANVEVLARKAVTDLVASISSQLRHVIGGMAFSHFG